MKSTEITAAGLALYSICHDSILGARLERRIPLETNFRVTNSLSQLHSQRSDNYICSSQTLFPFYQLRSRSGLWVVVCVGVVWGWKGIALCCFLLQHFSSLFLWKRQGWMNLYRLSLLAKLEATALQSNQALPRQTITQGSFFVVQPRLPLAKQLTKPI